MNEEEKDIDGLTRRNCLLGTDRATDRPHVEGAWGIILHNRIAYSSDSRRKSDNGSDSEAHVVEPFTDSTRMGEEACGVSVVC